MSHGHKCWYRYERNHLTDEAPSFANLHITTFFIVALFCSACAVVDPSSSTQADGSELAGESAGEIMAGEIMAGEIMAGEIMAGEIMAGEIMAGEMVAGEMIAGEMIAGEMIAGEMTAGAMIAGEMIAGEMIAGEMIAGEMIAGEMIAGAMIAGEMIAGEMIAGEMIAGEMIAGEMIAGEMIAGEMIAGEMIAGSVSPPADLIGYNLCGLGADVQRAVGTNADPIVATYSPFVDRHNTSQSTQDLYNTYDCAADRREFGREVIYEFTLPSPGYFRAEVRDEAGVDIDLHLLHNPSVDANGLVSGCLDRDDRLIEYDDLPAGTYQIVADSWTNLSGIEFEGAFDIAFEWLPYDQWTEAPIAEGVNLRRYLGDYDGARRLVHLLIADPGYEVSARRHNGCETVASALDGEGAFIGINANYFNSGQRCAPTDFLKDQGVTITRNGTTMFEQRTFGWDQAGNLSVRWLPYLTDWPEVFQGVGGYPSLIINGEVAVEVREGEQVYSSTDWSDQPRSAMGHTNTGQLVFAVADGRNRLSAGLFNMQWAQLLSEELNFSEAMGLDGGGSSTLVIRDCWLNHIVNFPSDSSNLSHSGERAVGSGLYLGN